jgi:succinoglycan biosynthesis transport protein ExoP
MSADMNGTTPTSARADHAPGFALSPLGHPPAVPMVIGGAGPALAGQPNAMAILRALARRWPLALITGLVCASVAAAAAWFAVPQSEYSTRAVLHVSSFQPNIIFKTAEARAEYGLYQKTLLTRLKGHDVLTAAQRNKEVVKLKLDRRFEDPTLWLEEEIQAGFVGEILTISMSGSRPGDLKVLVDAVTDAFMEEVVDAERKARTRRLDELKRLYEKYETSLSDKRSIRENVARQIGGNDKESIQLTQGFAIERQAKMRQRLLDVRMELEDAQIELNVKRRNAGALNVSESLIQSYVEKDPEIQGLKGQIEELEQQRRGIERIARRSDEVARQQVVRDLEDLGQKLRDRSAFAREWYAAQLQNRQRESLNLDVLEERIQVLKEMEKLASASVEDLGQESQVINKSSMELETLRDSIVHAEGAARRIGDEIEALNVELKAPDRVTVLEHAPDPRRDVDKRPRMAGMAGFGAFALVVFGITMYEYRSQKLGSADEVTRNLGLPLVGTLPEIPKRPRGVFGLGKGEDMWQNWMVESIDATRTMLLHGSATGPIQVVMVTSALPGEGKTSLASHLATSLARSGRRVLLLDADLRKPSIHHLFDVIQGPGFSDLILGEAELDEAIVPTGAPGFWILPAGETDVRAIQSLGLPRIGELFAQIRDRFDHVIVDTSPTLSVADALLIGRHVDAAICSVLRDVSRIPKVRAANERLSTLGIRVVGAVMTGVRGEMYGGSYAYYAQARS